MGDCQALGGIVRTHDINFQLNDGSDFGFMLAKSKGEKAWNVTRVFRSPPSMVKQEIHIVITAREDEMSASAVRQLKRMEEILEDLEKIMAWTGGITLVGLDDLSYKILIDKSGLRIKTLLHEQEREPEYQVEILIWGLYS